MNIKLVDNYIYNNNIDGLIEYSKSLSIENRKNFNSYLIEKLIKYKMPIEFNQRNIVALTLSELNCNDAVPYIIKIIINEHESKYIGTLIYSLQNLNCSDYLKHIFFLLYSGNYEVRRNIFDLIEQNKDKIPTDDLTKMRNDLIKIIEDYKDILLGLYIAKDELFNN